MVTKKETEDGLKEVLNELQPSLIIVDIMMPRMDGVGILLRIREWSSVPTILLSSWKAGKNKVRGLNVHSADGLSDPFGIDELMKWINCAR